MKTTDKSIKKTNSYLRMGIIMLTFAAVGAVIGFVLINILYGNINGIKTGFSGAVSQIQQFMVPLLLAIMAVSVIYGEVNLHKLKLIGKMILQTGNATNGTTKKKRQAHGAPLSTCCHRSHVFWCSPQDILSNTLRMSIM